MNAFNLSETKFMSTNTSDDSLQIADLEKKTLPLLMLPSCLCKQSHNLELELELVQSRPLINWHSGAKIRL